MTEQPPRIFDWRDHDDAQWAEITKTAYEEGKVFIRFNSLPGISVLYVEDLISRHPTTKAEEDTDGQ